MEIETIYKTEHKKYLDRLNNTPIVNLSLAEYLKASIKSHKDKSSLCIGWDYLKTNLTKDLKNIILNPEYQKITYNSKNEKFILDYLNIKNIEEELKKQLGSFVYVWKDIKREEDKKEQEENLKTELEKQGFIEIDPLEELKQLDGLKVECVLDVNAIGLLGSFDKKVIKEGRFEYSDYNKALMLIPKRNRTRGHIIRKKAYYRLRK